MRSLDTASDTSRTEFGQKESILVERYESKYVIPPRLVAPIRAFIEPFCKVDPHATGSPPEYVVTTLQLDNAPMSLHHAKEWDALDRFKLRVRTYGTSDTSPVYTEIKRKLKRVIVKSRAKIPRDQWCPELVLDPTRKLEIPFRSVEEEISFLEFARLTRQIGARPKFLIRYTRESYISKIDQYARVTFDRNLLFQATDSWTAFGRDGQWRHMDTCFTQDKNFSFSGVILEIKTLNNVPIWAMDLVERFDLVTTGNCKYSTAVWLESLFRGSPASPGYAVEMLTE